MASSGTRAFVLDGKLGRLERAPWRSPTVAALGAALGVQPDAALAEVCAALPAARPNPAFRAAYARLT